MSGQTSNFLRFCMIKSRSGKIDSLCSKLSQSDVKGLAKIAWKHEYAITHNPVILSRGQGQDQVMKGHQNQKLCFGLVEHDLQPLLHVLLKNRGHFTIWPHASEWQSRVRSTPGHRRSVLLRLVFSNKKWCFWIRLISGFHKFYFYFCAVSINAPPSSLKKRRHQRIRQFGLYVLQHIQI